MSVREYQNYFGQTATPFVIVSEFELTKTYLRIVFDGFGSIDRFESGDEPILNLRREFFVEGIQLENLRRNYSEVFEDIKTRTLEIAQAPLDYELMRLQLFIIKWVLVIQATRSSKDDDILRTKTAPEYHGIIANNLELVGQVLHIAWQYGKENDLWLNQLTEISELKLTKK